MTDWFETWVMADTDLTLDEWVSSQRGIGIHGVSYHKIGRAFDISVSGLARAQKKVGAEILAGILAMTGVGVPLAGAIAGAAMGVSGTVKKAASETVRHAGGAIK